MKKSIETFKSNHKKYINNPKRRQQGVKKRTKTAETENK